MGREFRAIAWAHAAAFLIALLATIVSVKSRHDFAKQSPITTPHGGQQLGATTRLSSSAVVSRPIYPYSVIPGGVESGPELKGAILRDPVAANHYADFDVAKAHVARLDRDQLAYVSYRMGDRIFWTSKKMKLAKGETVITDGTHEARTRCGNRVSETPGQPVSPSEPAPEEFQPSQPPQQVAILLPPQMDFPPATPPAFPPGPPPAAPPATPPGGGVIPPPYFPPVGGGGHPTPPPAVPPVVPPILVPEPGSFEMLSLGLAAILGAMGFVKVRRQRRA